MKTTLLAITFGLAALTLHNCTNNIGKQLPAFTAQTMSGKTITSSELKGKITVICVWATWCGNCLEEMPLLNALATKYKDDPEVVFLAITDDPADKVRQMLKYRSFNYVHITDAATLKDKLQTAMVQYIPENIVVDQDLQMVFDVSEEGTSIGESLENAIEQLKRR